MTPPTFREVRNRVVAERPELAAELDALDASGQREAVRLYCAEREALYLRLLRGEAPEGTPQVDAVRALLAKPTNPRGRGAAAAQLLGQAREAEPASFSARDDRATVDGQIARLHAARMLPDRGTSAAEEPEPPPGDRVARGAQLLGRFRERSGTPPAAAPQRREAPVPASKPAGAEWGVRWEAAWAGLEGKFKRQELEGRREGGRRVLANGAEDLERIASAFGLSVTQLAAHNGRTFERFTTGWVWVPGPGDQPPPAA